LLSIIFAPEKGRSASPQLLNPAKSTPSDVALYEQLTDDGIACCLTISGAGQWTMTSPRTLWLVINGNAIKTRLIRDFIQGNPFS
jgi:hypothetical protein